MLGDQEIEEFLTHIEELSQDSVCTDQYRIQKLQNENSRLRVILQNFRKSSQDVVNIAKIERQQKQNALNEIECMSLELEKLRNSYNELEKSNVNNQFRYKENLNELEDKNRVEHENYIELSKDYFELLAEVTKFYNFEIRKDRNKILCKTSAFLEKSLGDKYKKPKLVVKRSASATVAPKRTRNGTKEKPPQNAKRKKIDIWDIKSISEAPSPMSLYADEEADDGESECSFKTFSIGNETTFSAALTKTKLKAVCNCQVVAREPDLVSIATSTDDLEVEVPKSMPAFDDENNDEVSLDVFTSSDANSCDIEKVDVLPDISGASNSPHSRLEDNSLLLDTYLSPTKLISEKSIAISLQVPKSTTDQSTSPCIIEKCNKSTSTVHSVTHRGTMTPATCTKNIGIQFPDYTYEKILEEMSFDLPNCISPILDSDEDIPVTATHETQTDLHNVNREINYSNVDERKFLSNEEQSFIVLGQTVFNLFMDRLRESNKLLSDDAHTRERLREQLLDRFDELTFDEYFSPSFASHENVLRKVFEDVSERKKVQREVVGGHLSSSDESDVPDELCDKIDETNRLEADRSTLRLSISSEISSIEVKSRDLEEKIANNGDLLPISSSESLNISELNVSSSESSIEDNCGQMGDKIEEITSITSQTEKDLNIALESEKIQELSSAIEEVSSLTSKVIEVQTLTSKAMEIPNLTSNVDKTPNLSSQIEKIHEISLELPIIPEQPVIPGISDEQCLETVEPDPSEVERILQAVLSAKPRKLVSPIADLTDLMWSTVFPEKITTDSDDDCLEVDENVLDGYDIENDPIDIPLYGENDTPHPPPDCAIVHNPPYDPIKIPSSPISSAQKSIINGKILEFSPTMRLRLVTWQQNSQLANKNDEKRLCKVRKFINNYLTSEWTDENLQKCLDELSSRSQLILLEAIFETVEDNQWQKDVSCEFTPPAPPLPRYQQKLALLFSKLAETRPQLPHGLVCDLEMRLFKCENSSVDFDYLRNIAYYYTALIDLFFDGDPTIVFYFIIKCLYFYGYKAIPMVFVLIKAFPLALPKKSWLLKKYSTNIDWEKMTGIEMSKVRLDLEWMDSLELTVMYLLTNIQMYRRKGQEFKVIYEHELFNYLPKLYGFPLSFIAAPKLLDILVKRLEDGELRNLTMSLILLGKRMNKDFTVRMMLKGKLVPLLKKYTEELINLDCSKVKMTSDGEKLMLDSCQNNQAPNTVKIQSTSNQALLVNKVCLLIESISTILKPLTDEKDKIFNEIFPMIVNILGRVGCPSVQEYCLKAILRLQRFIENHKEIYELIKSHYEKRNAFSESLQHAIITFIHRKREAYFMEAMS